jgi:hypothetical protein
MHLPSAIDPVCPKIVADFFDSSRNQWVPVRGLEVDADTDDSDDKVSGVGLPGPRGWGPVAPPLR